MIMYSPLAKALDAYDPFVEYLPCFTGYINIRRVGRIVPYRHLEVAHPNYFIAGVKKTDFTLNSSS